MTKVTKITSNTEQQQYLPKDADLINSIKLQRKFGLPEDYIELHTFDLNNNLLKSNYNFTGYKSLLTSLPSPTNLLTDLSINPELDSINEGYDYGSTILEYNIFRNLFGGSINNKFYIKNVSSDRTELRVSINSISNTDLENFYNLFLIQFNADSFYKDFYLNFGTNNILIGVNIVLEQDPNQFNFLIKLYEPLPANIDLKDQFWFVDKLSDPISYQVEFQVEKQDINQGLVQLKGPNFDIKINEEVNQSIDYVNYDSFFSTTSTSSFQQIKSFLDEKSLDINVDYTEYDNFIHFSSAKERLLNFKYKLGLIEGYNKDYNTLSNVIITPQISSSKAVLQNNIDNIIEKFDGYEYYLYYESGSKAWPKKDINKPYSLYETTSSAVINWLGSDNDENILYGGQLYSASYYDRNNQDNILYTIPEYLRIDNNNEEYEVFLYMVGQHFDNVWLYSKGITDLYKAQNNISQGISKDLVSYALKSLGIKLYSNTNTTTDIFSYLLGVNTSGSYLVSTGSEAITSFVTASNNSLPGSEIDKEVYKRIYHNLPYLLKTKGTERGLRALISCYGIPDTILRINEFGGVDKDSGSYEEYYNKFSYSLRTVSTTGAGGIEYIQIPWAPSTKQSLSSSLESGSIVADTFEFRFKTIGIPTSSIGYSQSLFVKYSYNIDHPEIGIQLLYPQNSSSSYSEYGNMRLMMSGSNGYRFSSPIYLPFFNGDWWNLMVYRETGSLVLSNTGSNNTYWLYASANSDISHNIAYIGSASIGITGSVSSSYNTSWNSYRVNVASALPGRGTSILNGVDQEQFSGYFQEFRYWTTPLPVNNFIAHTLNPTSIECINETGSYNNLMFRLPFGTDLKQDGLATFFANSVHPYLSGSNPPTSSFLMTSNNYTSSALLGFQFPLTGSAYYDEEEFYYLNSGNLGLGKPVNDKIRIIDQDIASGSTLSPFTKIEQEPEVPLTKDINTLEIALSPQDQINNDIVSQLGYFDIDNYIGDPRESSRRDYSSLKQLQEYYFKKYINSYNVFDFIRILKYYNNSLFKMIKDFTPARTNVSTGIIIKSHLLERPKTQRFDPSVQNITYSQSIDTADLSGDEGGVFDSSLNYSFTESISSLLGPTNILNDKKWEIFNGQLSGSRIRVTSQSLQNNPYINKSIPLDINKFLHSDYNILINNVSQSRLSTKYFDVDYSSNQNNAVNLNLILSGSRIARAEIQDSNYSLTSYKNPRYLGSKTISQLYNVYSEGDKSYGKTSAIDYNKSKLGLFTNVTSSKFFEGKSETQLKYLVDIDGNLTELNIRNDNWVELQNLFKAGNNLMVGQFDPLKNNNQQKLDGAKEIYDSGYSYDPLLYFTSSDAKLYFSYAENQAIRYAKLVNGYSYSGFAGYFPTTLSSFNITRRTSNATDVDEVHAFLSKISSDNGLNYYVSSSTLFFEGTLKSYNDLNGEIIQDFDGSGDIGVNNFYYLIPTDGIYSFVFDYNIGSYLYEGPQNHSIFNTTGAPINYTFWSRKDSGFPSFIPNSYLSATTSSVGAGSTSTFTGLHYNLKHNGAATASVTYLSSSGAVDPVSSSIGFSLVAVNPGGIGSIGLSPSVTLLFAASASGYGAVLTGSISINSQFLQQGSRVYCFQTKRHSDSFQYFLSSGSGADGTIRSNLDNISFLPMVNDYNQYPMTLFDSGSSFYLSSFTPLSLITASEGAFIQSLGSSSIEFTSSLAAVYYSSSFIPNSSSLYNTFGDVYDTFNITSSNDTIIIKSTDGIRQYYVTNTYISNSLFVELTPPFVSENLNNIQYVLILKRKKNETNAIINYAKQPGPTSYGFIIPVNVNPDILKNIDVITKEVKTKLGLGT